MTARLQLLPATLFLFGTVSPAQQPASSTPSISPVGGWIATHKPADTLELWWHFFPDHTVFATAGSVTRARFTLAGNILTITPSAPHTRPTLYHLELRRDPVMPSDKIWPMDHLTLNTPGSAPALYDKLPAAGPILPLSLSGTWRLRTPPGTPHNLAPLTLFRPDGTTETRIPLKVMRGTWTSPATSSAGAGLFSLPDYPPLPFLRGSSDLVLALPPDGKDHRLYHPDDFPFSP